MNSLVVSIPHPPFCTGNVHREIVEACFVCREPYSAEMAISVELRTNGRYRFQFFFPYGTILILSALFCGVLTEPLKRECITDVGIYRQSVTKTHGMDNVLKGVHLDATADLV